MEWLQYLVASLFALLGAGCVVLILFSLPGTWIMIALAVVVELCDQFYLPQGAQQTFQWKVIGMCLALAAAGELLELLASAAGAKRGGASRRGMIGSIIGGIVGGLLLTLLIPIPVVGTLIGALVGTFVGAIIGEITHKEPKSVGAAIKPAIGATIGRVVGTTGKIAIAIAVWIALSISAFLP